MKNGSTLLLALMIGTLHARAILPPPERTNGGALADRLAEKILPGAPFHTVEVFHKNARLALGTVVSDDGLILSKLSDLELKINDLDIVLPGGDARPAKLVAQDRAADLALLKTDASDLRPVDWATSESTALERGMLVASPSRAGRSPLKLGVVAATSREIERSGGVMGVQLGRRRLDAGVLVSGVMDDSGAAQAGLKAGDIVLEVEGVAVNSMRDLSEKVLTFDPGETISLKVRRGETEQDFDVLLGHRSAVFGMYNRNLMMSGKTSIRKHGYARVIQHDIPLEVNEMGSPLLDMNGRAIGFNIAKANRVEYFALPVDVVSNVLPALIETARTKSTTAPDSEPSPAP